MAESRKLSNDEIISLFLDRSDPETGRCFGSDLLFIESYDQFFLYEPAFSYYRQLETRDIGSILYSFLLDLKKQEVMKQNQPVTDALISSIIKELKLVGVRSAKDADSAYISFTDGQVLDLASVPDFVFRPASRSINSFFSVPFTSHAMDNADCPKFLAFLNSILVKEDDPNAPDQELIDFMQRLFGYVLLPSLNGQAAFFFVGEKAANGKSTLVDILEALVGDKFKSALSIQDLSSNFALGDLRGKKLNIGDEEETKFASGAIFKKIVSGDIVSADVKFGSRVTFRNRAKFVFMTNSSPTFRDLDNGLMRRLFFIPFFKSFENDPNRRVKSELVAELLKELPGILRWALVGARLIRDENFLFKRTQAMQDLQMEFEREEKSAFDFIHENYQVTQVHDDSSFVQCDILFDQFKGWCDATNAKPMKRLNFIGEIRKRFQVYGVTKTQIRFNGAKVYGFYGLKKRAGENTYLETKWLKNDSSLTV